MGNEPLLSLLDYLRELANLRTRIVRNVEEYERVYWLADLPKVKGCYTRAWGLLEGGDEDLWVEVCRQPEPRLPAVPKACECWVDRTKLRDSDGIPALSEQIPEPTPPNLPPQTEPREVRFLKLGDYPEVRRKWDAYVRERWLPWREHYQRWKNIAEAYGELFAVHQSLQRLGEEFELVLALGFLTWKKAVGAVRRHVLTARTSLEFDAERGVFQVRPGADGAKLSFELEMLEAADRPPPGLEIDLASKIQESDDPWDSLTIHSALKSLVQALHNRGTYAEDSMHHGETPEFPVLTYAPALILRKRLPQGFLSMIQGIREQVEKGIKPPPALMRWLTLGDPGASRALPQPGQEQGNGVSADSRTYFPLPTNDEQARIVGLLGRHDAILVQGPPGTGKSHTIANLICHLLASGQRVLVTAQTPRALKVLQEKLPEEMRALCVSVLGNDRSALDGLERAVAKISAKHARWDEDQGQQFILQTTKSLEDVERRMAAVDNHLRQIREADSHAQEVAGGAYRGTAQSIAAQWASQRERFSWFRDKVAHDADCPCGPSTLAEFQRLCIEVGAARQAELRQSRPDLSRLPPPEEFNRHVQQERQALATASQYSDVQASRQYEALSRASADAIRALAEAIDRLGVAVDSAKHRPLAWIPNAVYEILADHDMPWRLLQHTTEDLLAGLSESVRATESHEIVLPSNVDSDRLLADAEDLKTHFDKGGRVRRWGMRPSIVKRSAYLLQSARVDGRPCNTSPALALLVERLHIQRTVNRLWAAWQGKAERTTGGLASQVSDVEQQLEALRTVTSVAGPQADAERACAAIPGLPQCPWHSDEAVRKLHQCCAAALAERRVLELRRTMSTLEDAHRQASQVPTAHPAYSQLVAAIEKRDVRAYGRAVEALQALERDGQRLTRRRDLEARLAALAPEFTSSLTGAPDDPLCEQIIPQFTDAWNWARAESWLSGILDDQRAVDLEKDLKNLSARRQQLLAELSAAKAWHAFFGMATDVELTHLKAWQRAVGKIGKGKGKYVGRHQREAQENLDYCRSVVPAWIMPLYRVFETVKPVRGMFDVVIVDEASQCGPDALLLLFLTKRIIIVGDDKQISPQAVGLDKGSVFRLIDRHLGDVELADQFDPETSLYHHAAMREGKSQVVLREHFRCVPEIIRFSNDHFYQSDPLIPLRQYPPDRLRPIVCRHVPGGYVEGSAQKRVNRPEADALVRAVCACNADPYYAGKTFGVVSLLGEQQARHIEQLLLEQLGSEDIEHRRLICGDAYSFQGDERDVMFLSMVAAPNEQYATLTAIPYKQRFNVAVSRARDQLWLFHTVTLNDLNKECLRYALLRHCQNPLAPNIAVNGLALDEIRRLAREARRDREKPPAPFDSWFEVDVFLAITQRGFRVIPQYKVSHYSIDLVVEGLQGRLAVECDGDEYHGAEQFQADVDRQRVLERSEWTFWRIRGAAFYRNQDAALESLLEQLRRYGIEPWVGDDRTILVLEGHVPSEKFEQGARQEEADPEGSSERTKIGDKVTSPYKRARLPREAQEVSETGDAAGNADLPVAEAPAPSLPGADSRSQGEASQGEAVSVGSGEAQVAQVQGKESPGSAGPPAPVTADADAETVDFVQSIDARTWFALSHWARVKNVFQPWARSLLYNIGRRVAQGIPVTVKQARQARRFYEEGLAQGFAPEPDGQLPLFGNEA